MYYWIGHYFFKLFFMLFLDVRVQGVDNVPRRGAVILASNHLSNLDPMLVGVHSRRRMNYLAKEDLFKNSFASFILNKVGAIALKRDRGDYSALRTSLARLKNGEGLVLFPEGSRSMDGSLQEAKLGVGLIAAKSQALVIPAAVTGSDKAMPKGARRVNRATVTIRYGKPLQFEYKKTQRKEHYQEIADKVMSAIAALR